MSDYEILECPHEFDAPHRYSRIHSSVTCKVCGYEHFIPTPDHLKPAPDWANAVEVVE